MLFIFVLQGRLCSPVDDYPQIVLRLCACLYPISVGLPFSPHLFLHSLGQCITNLFLLYRHISSGTGGANGHGNFIDGNSVTGQRERQSAPFPIPLSTTFVVVRFLLLPSLPLHCAGLQRSTNGLGYLIFLLLLPWHRDCCHDFL